MIEVGVKTQNHTQTWKIFEQEQEQVKRNIAERCLLVSLCFRILKKQESTLTQASTTNGCEIEIPTLIVSDLDKKK